MNRTVLALAGFALLGAAYVVVPASAQDQPHAPNGNAAGMMGGQGMMGGGQGNAQQPMAGMMPMMQMMHEMNRMAENCNRMMENAVRNAPPATPEKAPGQKSPG